MFGEKSDFESLKMIDFGLSTFYKKQKSQTEKENMKAKKPDTTSYRTMKTKAGTS